MAQLTGLLGGYNEQRADTGNYLAQLDQMQRAAIQQQLERQRMEQQAQQFVQSNMLQQQQLAQTGSLRQAEMAQAAQAHRDALAQQAQQFGLQSREQQFKETTQNASTQRQEQARNALAQLLNGPEGGDIATADLARAILPYDIGQGASLLKASKEEQRQQALLDRTGGNGVQPPTGYRWTAQGNLEAIPGGNADPDVVASLSESKRQANEKALPTSAAQKLMENNQNLRRAEQALALSQGKEVSGMQGDTAATGWKGYVPQGLLNRLDPQGADTRAAIADLGSLVLHERSGAAITASEEPRLRPFIPDVHDDQATIQKKLARFAQVYGDIVGDATAFYKESGYKVPTETLRHAQVTGEQPQGKSGNAAAGTTFSSLPDPRQYKGRTVIDPSTGMRMTSNGSDWIRQ